MLVPDLYWMFAPLAGIGFMVILAEAEGGPPTERSPLYGLAIRCSSWGSISIGDTYGFPTDTGPFGLARQALF
jgi:hypothetical protein